MKTDYTIILNKCSFSVYCNTPNSISMVKEFSRRFNTFTYVYNHKERRKVKVLDRQYHAGNKNLNEYIFHIFYIKDFMWMLNKFGYGRDDIDIFQNDTFKPNTLGVNFNYKKYILRDYQELVNRQVKEHRDVYSMLIDHQTGKGKMEYVENLIRIPNGWKRMGDIKVGDFVISKNGNKTKVIGAYPNGIKPLYKMKFIDGREVIIGLEHLWTVIHKGFSKHKRKVMSTDDIMKNLLNTKQKLLYIDLPEHENIEDKNLLIDPYIMGVFIGDGSIGTEQTQFTSMDIEIINKINNRLPLNHSLKYNERYHYRVISNGKKNVLRENFKIYGLNGKKSFNKFIPNDYLNASLNQKYELLQGLMDTDGYVDKNGNLTYSTTSKELADNIRTLIWSIGGMAKLVVKEGNFYTYKNIRHRGRTTYKLNIRLKNPRNIVSLPRKLNRIPLNGRYNDKLALRIESVEYCMDAEAKCIAVDSADALYITENYIVTHNTIMSISSICDINKAVGILILPKYIEKWVKELKETTDIRDEDIAVVQGSKDLITYMNLAKTGNYKAKIIIFSNRTISNYMRDYEECDDMDNFMYPVIPTELTNCFKLGILMIDEVHQEFFSVYKACLYFNVELILGMSATLTSEDPSKERYHTVLFPHNVRLSNLGHDKYIDLHEIRYNIDNPRRIRCVNNMGYNHILFEQSIMRHSIQIRNYVDMIKYYIKKGYLDRKEKGDKLLIFAASIDLCTLLTYTVKSMCQDLKVSRYVEDDPFENLVDSDIIISTVLSSGTAFDIPGLITVIQTISVKSKQANIQAIGRLRKKDGKQMKYYQLFSKDIQKQNDYHKYRIEMLGPRIKELYLEEYIKPV